MTKDEALEMCLEYIETNALERRFVRWAIKEALAQPEQESTNWHVIDPTGNVVATEKDAIHGWARLGGFKPTLEVLLAHHESGWRVVPAPPLPVQPERQPLTDEEIAEVAERMEATDATSSFWREFARAIEAKLKEKNA